MDEKTFWELSPKKIDVYFRAYNYKRQTQVQDLWLQGVYFARAIQSTIWFGKGKAPEYPQRPMFEEQEKELLKDEEWVKRQQTRAYLHFKNLLEKRR